MSRTRYHLSWTYTDIDGNVRKQGGDGNGPNSLTRWYGRKEAEEAYERKVRANDYLLGGATITDVKLFEIEVEETWTQIRGTVANADDDH